MSARLEAAIRGDLRGYLASEASAGRRAVTNVVRRWTNQVKGGVRAAISGAGLGTRLGNAIRGRVFPDHGYSLSAKGRVESAAIYKRPGGLVDLITVYQEGATITSSSGRFLVIPVGAGKKEKLEHFDRHDIEILPFRKGRGFVVLRRGSRRRFGAGGGGILFILVPVVRVRPRLNLDQVVAAAEAALDQQIVDEWETQAGKAGVEA